MGDRGYENGEGPIVRRIAEAVAATTAAANDNTASLEAVLSGGAPPDSSASPEIKAMLAVCRMLDRDLRMLRARRDGAVPPGPQGR